MKYNKYYKDNNIIHVINIDINEISKLIGNIDSIYSVNSDFNTEFNKRFDELSKDNSRINIRLDKVYSNYGNRVLLNKLMTQNINCYRSNSNKKNINIYYDLINKYNANKDEIINRFVITLELLKRLSRLGYNINFIPTLFLKAFDKIDNNEYVLIEINNLNVNNIMNYNLILNSDVSTLLLPKLIKLIDIENKHELDYNGYLLERTEKESILNLSSNDILIDIFTSDELFNGDIFHDKDIFYKKLILK